MDLKKALRSAGSVLLGGMVSEYLRPSLIKLYKHAGFDFVFIENEHGMLLGPELNDFVLSARDNGLPVISKVARADRGEVVRLLDAGVSAIQLPWTETRRDVEAMLDLMRFPPTGRRPGAPGRGNTDYLVPEGRQWMEDADDEVMLVAHIETERGMENAAEIVRTPGLDMLYAGPYDLSVALGHPGEFDHPRVKNACFNLLDRCLEQDVVFGTTPGSIQIAAELVERGCRFFLVVDEYSLLYEGALKTVEAYRAVMP